MLLRARFILQHRFECGSGRIIDRFRHFSLTVSWLQTYQPLSSNFLTILVEALWRSSILLLRIVAWIFLACAFSYVSEREQVCAPSYDNSDH